MKPEALALYEKYYGAIDAWRPRFMHKAEGEMAFGEELCPLNELGRTEFFNDYLSRFDIELFCAVATLKRATGIELVSLYKGWKGKPPARESLEWIQLVLPHLHSALRTRARLAELEAETTNYAHALDLLDFGVILLDASGSRLFLNRAAEQILNQRDGLYINDSKLGAGRRSEALVLRALIDRTIAGGLDRSDNWGGATSITRLSGMPVRIVVAPFVPAQHSGMSRAAAIVFISDPGRLPDTLARVLQSLYGLTSAECRLAELLAAGKTLAESAAANHVTRETVRSQLRSIFDKTGARRQGELIRILTSLPRLKKQMPNQLREHVRRPRASLCNQHSPPSTANSETAQPPYLIKYVARLSSLLK